VQDVRCGSTKHNNCFRVVRYDAATGVITAGGHPSASGQAVADPRSRSAFAGKGKYIVTPYSGPANTVIGASTTGNGAFAVADPHPGLRRGAGDAYLTAGHYGVVGWEQSSGAVSGAACHDNGPWSVADIRLPAPNEKLVALIRAEDGTWHRPFTTLELAALQSLFDPDDPADVAAFTLEGNSDSAWRERIGNAVPPAAAEAIATEILRTLLLADAGETFQLGSAPVWVKPVAAALSLPDGANP
jgi:site-specific DNA-cytosine methylase